jgi:predicted transcriptional regulator
MHQTSKLSRREREILDVLFALGNRATADEIRARLTDPPGYSAVRAMLARMETKGIVRHHEEGVRYVYTPAISRASERRRALGSLVGVFFRGSPREAATALLRQEDWPDDELDALQAEINRVKAERGRS